MVCSLKSAVCGLQSANVIHCIITMHIHDSVYSQKVAAKRKYCQFWNVFKMQEIRFCMKFGWLFAEILQSEYQEFSRGVHTEITVFSKLKTERNFNQQGQNVTEPESIFNSLMNLDVNWNTNWALFSVLLPTAIHNPLQSDSFS